MRLIDADELMEHVWRDKLDSRELIAKMINDAPTVKEIPTKIPLNIFEQLISRQPCKDCISRQSVLDTIESWLSCDDYNGAERHIMRAMQSVLYDLPPVTPKEKTGRWIKIQSGDGMFPMSIACSKCNNENSHLDFNEHAEPIGKVFIKSKYCPNCGARMEVEE